MRIHLIHMKLSYYHCALLKIVSITLRTWCQIFFTKDAGSLHQPVCQEPGKCKNYFIKILCKFKQVGESGCIYTLNCEVEF